MRKKLIIDGDSGSASTMQRQFDTKDKLMIFDRHPDGGETKGPYHWYRACAQLETKVDDDAPTISDSTPTHSLTYFHITTPTPALSPLRFTIKLDQHDLDRDVGAGGGIGQGPEPYTGKVTFLVDQRMEARELMPDPYVAHEQFSGTIKYPYADEYEPHQGSTEEHAEEWEKTNRPGYGTGAGSTEQKKARLQATLERMNDLAKNGGTPLRIMLSTESRVGWLPHITPMDNNDINTGDIDSDYDGTSGFFLFRAINSTVDDGADYKQGVNGEWVQAATLVSTDGYRKALKNVWQCIGEIAAMLDIWKERFNHNVVQYNSHTHLYSPGPGTPIYTSEPQYMMATYTPAKDFHEAAQDDYAASWTNDNIK